MDLKSLSSGSLQDEEAAGFTENWRTIGQALIGITIVIAVLAIPVLILLIG